MNITNSDYFTFNVGNSILLVGQTGCGKTVMNDALIKRFIAAKKPSQIRFALFDMTGFDFFILREDHPEYLDDLVTFETEPEEAFKTLEKYANLSEERTLDDPLLFIFIEECDMTAVDQERFDKAVIKMNTNAKKANMKLVYSTSRPGPSAISEELMASFDIILAGQLASEEDYEYIRVPQTQNFPKYGFTVVEQGNETSQNE